MTIADLVTALLGDDLPVALRAYDGSRAGPSDAAATLVLRSPTALAHLVQAPGDLGFGRAYVAGDLDVEGDLFALLALRHRLGSTRLSADQWLMLARRAGPQALRPVPRPTEEARLRGRRHSKARDAAAIAHHYDLPVEFFRTVLGPSLTYSCATWTDPSVGLEVAQAAKHELVCSKLGLRPGMRLLDVGCGWGSMVIHAAAHHGVEAVGITLSRAQAEVAAKRVAEAGLGDRVTIRLQDYRDVDDGPYDAISSIGMFEHVGEARLAAYFSRLHALARPGARLLNHGISRPGGRPRARFRRASFIDRYVFPDGELHEVGRVVSRMQDHGFEVRHVESLREHYALTLRAWVANLEAGWDDAVAAAGARRARIWRLYMAASAVGFEDGNISVHQVLAVKPDRGRSGMPLRPVFNEVPRPPR